MRLLNLHILTHGQLKDFTAATWQKAEAATVEICARHIEDVRDKSKSETARKIMESLASSLRKLTNIKNG